MNDTKRAKSIENTGFEVTQALIYLKLYFCSPALAGLFLFVALLRTKRTPPRLWAGGVLL